ncbi:hypothetical protein [Algibacter lectus]
MTFETTLEELQFFDRELHKKGVEPGDFEIGIGPSSNNFETVKLIVTN